MANTRVINTKFWVDNYTANLDPVEKLLFLYFLTNPATDICGFYQLPLRNVAVDTGIDREMVEKIIARFSRDGKIFYINGWVCIINFAKNQARNPSVDAGIQRCMANVPQQVLDQIPQPVTGSDSLGQPVVLNLTKLNLTKHNLTTGTADAVPTVGKGSKKNYSAEGAEVVKAFESVNPTAIKWYGNTTQRQACDDLIKAHGLEKVLKVIEILPKTNGMQYVPTITTPLQLRDKWAGLGAALQKQSNTTSKFKVSSV